MYVHYREQKRLNFFSLSLFTSLTRYYIPWHYSAASANAWLCVARILYSLFFFSLYNILKLYFSMVLFLCAGLGCVLCVPLSTLVHTRYSIYDGRLHGYTYISPLFLWSYFENDIVRNLSATGKLTRTRLFLLFLCCVCLLLLLLLYILYMAHKNLYTGPKLASPTHTYKKDIRVYL
jgi:hypothetical protein